MTKLPIEIWMMIVELLIMPELREASCTCKGLKVLCKKRLKEQQAIARKYRWFDVDNEKNYWKHGYIIHKLFFALIRGGLSGSYIFEFNCSPELEWYDQPSEELDETREEATRMTCLIREFVMESPWILSQEKEDCIEAICSGNEDAVLSVMFPLLTNLRAFAIPGGAPLLERTITRIIQVSVSNTINKPLMPLSKLVLVTSHAYNGNEGGMDLEGVVVYAAIPSVRRVVVYACCSSDWSGGFSGWPADLPLSHAREVFFSGSCVVPADAISFAAGFAGPCIMRQTWFEHGSWPIGGERGLEWNYLEIVGTGTEREIKEPQERSLRDAGLDYVPGVFGGEVFETDLGDWKSLI